MKICFFCFGFATENIKKQPWKFVYEICRGLISLNVDVVIISDGLCNRLELCDDFVNNIRVKRVKKLRSIFTGENQKCLEIIEKEIPDVVILLQGFTSYLNTDFIKKLKKRNIPVIGILTSPLYGIKDFFNLSLYDLSELRNLFIHLINALIPKYFIKRAINNLNSITIVLSQNLREKLISIGVKQNKVFYVRNSVDDFFLHIDRSQLDRKRYPEGEIVILYFGPAGNFRGLDLLLKSFFEIKKTIFNIKLILLLRPDKNDIFKRINRLKKFIKDFDFKDITLITESLSPLEIKKYILNSDIVVLPFKLVISEIPLVILEAMSCGKPVISTKIDGIPEILSKGRGIIIKPSVKELTTSLKELLANEKLRNKIGKNAREYIENLPSWSMISKEMYYLINQVLKMSKIARVIAFCGPDGAGKTSLLKLLENYIKEQGFETKYVWFRFNHYLTKIIFALSRFFKTTKSIKIGKKTIFKYHTFYKIPFLGFLFVMSQLIDVAFAFIFKIWLPFKFRNYVILCDRFIIDIIIDIMVETGFKKIPIILFKFFLPRWIKIIVITSDYYKLKSRRPENKFDPFFHLRLNYYLDLSKKFNLPVIFTDDDDVLSNFKKIINILL